MNRTRHHHTAGMIALAATLTAAGCASHTPDNAAHDTAQATDTTPAKPLSQPTPDDFITDSDGIRIDHRAWAEIGYRWDWTTTPLYRGQGLIDFISPMDDLVAVQSQDAWTCLVDADTGNTIWQVRNANQLTSFLANVRIGTNLLSFSKPELFIMDINTGNLLARQPVEIVVSTPPTIDGGYAVFGTPTGQVLAHRFGDRNGNPLPPPLDSGLKGWGYLLDHAISAPPVKVGQNAGIVSDAGEVFFVDITSGSGQGYARISDGSDTAPVTDGTRMFVASRDQSLYAFAPGSDTYFWRERTEHPLNVQPTYHDGVLYCDITGRGLVAFDVSQNAADTGTFGTTLWESPVTRGEVIASQNADLVVWDGESVHRIDTRTGDVIASTTISGVSRLYAGEFTDGEIYAVGNRGQLIRFSAR